MVASRTSLASLLLVVGLACGPATGLDSESGSGTGTGSDPTVGEGGSVDESGGPNDACGVGDTELIGGGPPGPLGFPPPCDPSQDPGTNGYRCCSDDPAAPNGALPDYQGKNIENGAPPLFSGVNNALSRYGMCVDVAQIAGQGLTEAGAENCPIPCNPTWPPESIDDVCGPTRQCCQTVELQPADCIQDPDSGLYRPVTGNDIGISSQWRPQDHATHQDPNGANCLALASGDPAADVFQACVRALSVANQRGYCMALAPGAGCPHAEPGYVDACEQLNGG